MNIKNHSTQCISKREPKFKSRLHRVTLTLQLFAHPWCHNAYLDHHSDCWSSIDLFGLHTQWPVGWTAADPTSVSMPGVHCTPICNWPTLAPLSRPTKTYQQAIRNSNIYRDKNQYNHNQTINHEKWSYTTLESIICIL